MAAAVEGRGVRLRPHAKSHKCPDIARRQIAAGAVGVCCQKVGEAEAFVAAGVTDVLITNEIVGAAKLARLAALARSAKLGVLVDDRANVARAGRGDASGGRIDRCAGRSRRRRASLRRAARRARARAGPRDRRRARASLCRPARLPGRGATPAATGRAARGHRARGRAGLRDQGADRAGRNRLRARSPAPAPGPSRSSATAAIYTELQPGSYVFMDADYGRNERADDEIRFEQSLFVWTTVMSTPAPDRAIVDAGLKAFAVDSGMPLVADAPGLELTKASDEHGVVRIAPGAAGPRLGDRLQAGARTLRSDGQSLRLDRRRAQRPGRGAVAGRRARRADLNVARPAEKTRLERDGAAARRQHRGEPWVRRRT